MTKAIATILAASFLTMSGLAYADADDAKWIAQCIRDNKGEGAKEEVVYKYCQCMVDKMEANETRSVTQFEKANPESMRVCEKQAGWK